VPGSDVIMTRRQAAMLKNFDPLAPSHLTKLRKEVLEHIFKFLDRKSLLNCLLVNSRWNLIIEASSKLMKNFPLTVTLEDGAQYFELKKTQRCFQEIKVIAGYGYKIPKKEIEALTKIGANVKTISYNKCGKNFSEVVSCFPNIETLVMNKVAFFKLCINHINTRQLPNVKTLKIIDSSFYKAAQLNAFFLMFPKVQHLFLVDMNINIYGLNDENVQILTSNLKHVETLTVWGNSKEPSDSGSNVRIISGFFRFVNHGAFENLRELKLMSFNASELILWAQFIASNPKLQVIDIEIETNEHMLNFKELVMNSRDGMKLIMRGNFKLTEQRLRHFKENSSRRVQLQIPKQSLMMAEEVLEEIMGGDKKLIELL
jgi:F-box-like